MNEAGPGSRTKGERLLDGFLHWRSTFPPLAGLSHRLAYRLSEPDSSSVAARSSLVTMGCAHKWTFEVTVAPPKRSYRSISSPLLPHLFSPLPRLRHGVTVHSEHLIEYLSICV